MVTCQRTPIERKQLWESIMGINVELVICMLDAHGAKCHQNPDSYHEKTLAPQYREQIEAGK